MSSETKELSQGVEVLFTLFFGQPKKIGKEECYDFFTFFFYKWCVEDKAIPEDKDLKGIYWEFLWKDVVVWLLEDEYMDADKDSYHENVDDFRIKAMRKLVLEIDPAYLDDPFSEDILSLNDISVFLQLIAKNRIWWDMLIKKNEPLIRRLVSYTTKKAIASDIWDVDTSSVIEKEWGGIDWLNPDIYYTDAFQRLEKENWKKYVMPEYHSYVDQLDLTTFKQHLKDPLGREFCPLGWQGEFLVKHSRFNFIAWSRRIGKTFLGAWYLCGRQIMLPMQNVIYIVPTLKNHAEPAWQDLEIYFKDFPEISFDKSKYVIKNKQTSSTIRFVTAERKHAVRGSAAHLLVCDEMAFVSEVVFETASALVSTTNGMIYGISTVNPDVPKNYFYYNLLQAEVEMMTGDSEYYGRRVSLDDNPFISDKEKARIKAGARNMDLFNAEWMAVFLDKDSFNLQNFWIMDEKPVDILIDGRWKTQWRAEAMERVIKKYYDKFIISHDGAKRKDKPWVTVYWIRDWEMHTVMAAYAEWFEYWDQVDIIVEIARMLWWLWSVDIVIDYWGAWIAVEEIFRKKKWVYPICVQTVGDSFEGKDWFVWRVWKDMMKNKLRAGLDLWCIKWFSFMSKLRLEFEWFSDEEENKRRNWNHFDLLKSMFQAYWWAEKSWYLQRQDIPKDVEMVNDEFWWMPDSPIYAWQEQDEFERFSKYWY